MKYAFEIVEIMIKDNNYLVFPKNGMFLSQVGSYCNSKQFSNQQQQPKTQNNKILTNSILDESENSSLMSFKASSFNKNESFSNYWNISELTHFTQQEKSD